MRPFTWRPHHDGSARLGREGRGGANGSGTRRAITGHARLRRHTWVKKGMQRLKGRDFEGK
jgi:hypothetical protein